MSSKTRMTCYSVGKQVVILPLQLVMWTHISVPAGPSHMSLYVRPRAGAALSRWSLGDGMPVASLGGDYFVFYSHGLHAAPWLFWVELTVSAAGNLVMPWSALFPPWLHSYVKSVLVIKALLYLIDLNSGIPRLICRLYRSAPMCFPWVVCQLGKQPREKYFSCLHGLWSYVWISPILTSQFLKFYLYCCYFRVDFYYYE